jgi:hypothetical protein
VAWSIKISPPPVAAVTIHPNTAPLSMVGQAPTLSQAGGGAMFDRYISTTGSDSNTGTLASPWAITAINTKQSAYAGLRLGILPGIYDVSGLMGTFHSPALMINGGPNSSALTYIGTSDSSGNYSPRTATLDAKGASGVFGGGNSNICTIIGSAAHDTTGPATPANWGNWTLDGLVIVGGSNWMVQVGSYDSTGGAQPNVVIKNCEIANSNSTNSPFAGTHYGPMELYQYTSCLISNCWFHDNVNNSSSPNNNATHFESITVWGGVSGGTSRSEGLTIELCTFGPNTPGVYGIYDTGIISGTTIRQCYFDMSSASNAGTGVGVVNCTAILGFGQTSSDNPSSIHNNIIRGGTAVDAFASSTQDQWASAVACYNNTWDLADGAGAVPSPPMGFRFYEASGHSGVFTNYNNLCYDNGFAGSMSYGYQASNVDGFALCDYNIYGTRNQFATAAANGGNSPTSQTFTSWKTAIGGLETHSTTNATNPFTNVGIYALQYTTPSGPAFQAGRVGGLSGGATVNVGAWDGIVTQIGCNFAT